MWLFPGRGTLPESCDKTKIGSPENSCPVIYHGGYMVANYKNGYDFVW
uniref:Uncharacterized protein n=1 Tax=Salmonella enterica subsp. indica TaxID=59207 RepID=I3W3V7_SALER|nr:hypothetical protein [Salmonella enterica subsp. indica]